MSSSNSPVLQLEISHGLLKQGLIVAMLAVSGGIPWLIAGLSPYFSLTMMTTNLSVALLGCWRLGWLGKRFRLNRVVWDGAGGWWLLDRAGRHAAELQADSVVFRLFFWLKWRCNGRSSQALIFSRECSSEDWRRWHTRLRWEGRTGRTVSSEPK